jgi:hypothetical protein
MLHSALSPALCSTCLSSLHFCHHRRCSLKSPQPPPSYAQGPSPSRSLPRATGRHEGKDVDDEFFVHHERISGVGLLWWSPEPAELSTSFASPTRRSPTSRTLALTPPLASHRHPPLPKMRHCMLSPPVSPSSPMHLKSVPHLSGFL